MKPTVRVSIGGLAFNLDEDAYRVLNNYLQALKRHFAANPEGDEIISDIEARLSELLQMRISNAEGVVSENDAQEIIKVMGSPKDFDDTIEESEKEYNAGQEDTSTKEYATGGYFKKKLYRDTENKFIGGVCSGLSHYFRVDTTVIRLLFAGLFVFLFVVGNRIVPSCIAVVLIYAILWAVMPVAKTFTQKLSMTGADPSIMNIEDRAQTPKKYRGSGLSAFVSVLITVIVGIIAVSLLVTIIGIIASILWLHFDTEILGFNNYLILTGYNSINLKIAAILALLLPPVGLLVLMIKVLRHTPYTTRTMVNFTIGLVVWLGAVFYLVNAGVKFGNSHKADAKSEELLTVNTASDSLYIRLGDEYQNAKFLPNNPFMLYKGENESERELCLLPKIRVKKDTTLTDYVVEIHKRAYADNAIAAKRESEILKLDYVLTDSLLVINPKWYNNSHPWDLETFEIVVTAPRNKNVLREEPLRESYDIKDSYRVKKSYRNVRKSHCIGNIF
ncbi:MAG: PspC domain-containing protein [Prevotella sp.]|jgi:phage shock protein PspC (stress-responsive transcriptional regulator)|nr:PspC domain-containing protein [Prevotella sp.]